MKIKKIINISIIALYFISTFFTITYIFNLSIINIQQEKLLYYIPMIILSIGISIIAYLKLENVIEDLKQKQLSKKIILIILSIFLTIQIAHPLYASGILAQIIKAVLIFIFSTITTFTLFNILSNINVEYIRGTKIKVSIKDVVVFFIIALLVWGFFYYTYFPGIMTSDSISQWEEAINYSKDNQIINDWHPAFHTIVTRWLLLIVQSPAIISGVQLILLSLLTSYVFALFKSLNINKKLLYIVFACVLILPANCLMFMHLWKDIAYAYAIMYLTITLVILMLKDVEFFKSKLDVLNLLLALIGVLLFRHNGIVPFLLTCILILLIYIKNIKKIIIPIMLCLIIPLLFKTMIYNIYNVIKQPEGVAYSYLLHQLAYVYINNGDMTEEQIELMEGIMPKEAWEEFFIPYTHDGLLFNSGYNYQGALSEHKNEIIKTYISVFFKNPIMCINDMMNLNNLVYFVRIPEDGYMSINSNRIELENQEDLDRLGLQHYDTITENGVNKYIELTQKYIMPIWRHSIYLYITLLCAIVAIYKNGIKSSIIYIPILGNIASYAISIIAQDFRYIYSTILCVPIFIMFALLDVRDIKKEDSSDAQIALQNKKIKSKGELI